ncbi:hypothetical protein [Croceiramulus getboli]|nr:hypothetical protein P8624_12025 [Flavobacteriaceae bacterium YJPT1-3]
MKRELPEHVKAYRYESWQIEMLIAGGVLFALYESSDFLKALFYEYYPISDTTSNKIILLFGSFILAKILLIGFAANLLLRAVWLGYLGIAFWFPEDINLDRVRGNTSFKQNLQMQKGNLARLLLLEKWCNLSFSAAVLLGFFTLSLLISVSVVIFLLDQFDWTRDWANSADFTYFLTLFFILIQLGVLDRLLIRKKTTDTKVSQLRQSINRFFNTVTLSFLFKREFMVLRSNTNPWIFNGLLVVYLFIAITTSINDIGSFYRSGTFNYSVIDDREEYSKRWSLKINPVQYTENLGGDNRVLYGAIQSEIVKENYLKLFLVSWVDFDNSLNELYQKYEYQEYLGEVSSSETRDSLIQVQSIRWNKALNEQFQIHLDSAVQDELQWALYRHPVTLEEGYLTYLPIDSLTPGLHQLNVSARIRFPNGVVSYRSWLDLPFWYQSPIAR